MSAPTSTDPFEGLDPHVRRALGAWQSLTAEQRDYAMGYMSGWVPDVVLSASAKAVEISRLDHELTQIGVAVETRTTLRAPTGQQGLYQGWER
ncbi:hypothetical protein [Nocardia sp. NPDC057030]|uniref:hypothetical protein n=1 Tax=unclassified Nocardia TaxID=2637762 RepID=UPI003636C1F3